MVPKVHAEKRRVWAQMTKLMEQGSVPTAEYGRLYRRRAYLNGKVRAGEGDLKAHAAEIESINQQLRAIRAADPGSATPEVLSLTWLPGGDSDHLSAQLLERRADGEPGHRSRAYQLWSGDCGHGQVVVE